MCHGLAWRPVTLIPLTIGCQWYLSVSTGELFLLRGKTEMKKITITIVEANGPLNRDRHRPLLEPGMATPIRRRALLPGAGRMAEWPMESRLQGPAAVPIWRLQLESAVGLNRPGQAFWESLDRPGLVWGA